MSASRVFLYLCLAFVGGIFINSVVFVPQLLMLGFLIPAILLISVFLRYKKLVIIGFCLLFLILGIWRHQVVEMQISKSDLQSYNDKENAISLVGVVVEEPDVRESSIKLTIKPENMDGKVLVTASRYEEYQYGDKLKITGQLKTPQVFEDFNYKDYLAKDGIYSVIYWPQTELLNRNHHREPFSVIYSKILDFKDKLRESIYQNLSPPQSSILGAMILGDKRKMSSDLKEKLNIAGVRHITAISGMHVAILTAILMGFLTGLGLWRKQAFYLTVFLIALFIIMTGLQSSAIRAGIMGGLFLLAQYLGRPHLSARTVVFAAAFMLAQNPLLLRLDIGFQLSFLAVMGIIYLGPVFRNWLKFIPEKSFINLRSISAMTLSAQIFTLPILLYNFGYVSSVSLVTNILIVPLLPYIMVLGFISAFLGIIWQPLGWLFSLPVWLLLTYVVKIVDGFSQIPWAALVLANIHWAWLIAVYLILGCLTWCLKQREKLKFLNY